MLHTYFLDMSSYVGISVPLAQLQVSPNRPLALLMVQSQDRKEHLDACREQTHNPPKGQAHSLVSGPQQAPLKQPHGLSQCLTDGEWLEWGLGLEAGVIRAVYFTEHRLSFWPSRRCFDSTGGCSSWPWWRRCYPAMVVATMVTGTSL